MKFFQVARTWVLLIVVNMFVMLTLAILVRLILGPRVSAQGYEGLLLFCLIFGMGGAFISLLISRWMAKVSMGVQVIDPETSNPDERGLVQTVYRLARQAGMDTMPEVGIYESPEVNAFATGPSKAQALVAVSSGLLQNLRPTDIEGVLGHEITHITNGDMVTMTLLQGVVNAIAMFLARILAAALSQNSSRDDERGGNNFFMEWILISVFQNVLMLLGSLVVLWFSRWREFRADAGGARLAGRDHMISALRALQHVHEAGADEAGAQPAFQALKISGRTSSFLGRLLADHPPIEERIARLESGAIA